MRLLRVVAAFLFCAFLACPSFALAGPGEARSPGPGGLAGALWPPEKLAHDPAERRAGPRTAPDDSPPARTTPLRTLPPLGPGRAGSLRRVDPGPGQPPLAALTFDLCELATRRAGYEGRVADLLRVHGAGATFFASGKWMRSHPERTLQLMADPLFELGNHAWTHGNLGVLSGQAARDQVLWTQAQYELLREELARRAGALGLAAGMSRIPEVPALFRLPYGRCSPAALEMLAGLGLSVIQWDVVAAEESRDADAAAADVLARVRPGSIVLLHANAVPASTADILERLLPALKTKGYRLVTVSELLASGRPRLHSECYFNRPGDNLDLDRVYGDGTRHPAHAGGRSPRP